MIALILAVPAALATLAGIHGLKARKRERAEFDAHSDRLRELR